MVNSISQNQTENFAEVVEAASIDKLKDFLKENYKWTFNTNDKKNPYFNQVEISKGELIYKRILFGKEDVNFELQITSELLEILNNRSLNLSEFEALNNKNFHKIWACSDRKILRTTKKGYSFEIGISLNEI